MIHASDAAEFRLVSTVWVLLLTFLVAISPPAPASSHSVATVIDVAPRLVASLRNSAPPMILPVSAGGLALQIDLEAVQTIAPDRRAWFGRVRGRERSGVTLVISDQGYVAAAVRLGDGRVFELRPGDRPGRVIVVESDSRGGPGCGGGQHWPEPVESAPEKAWRDPTPAGSPAAGFFCDDGTRLDVLVLYTTQARLGAGGTAQIHALIDLAVADANAAFDRSGVNTSVVLVHREEVTYPETGDWTIDGPRLVNPSDGFIDQAHILRDQYGADLVSLWVEQLNAGGIGYFPDPSLTGVGASGFSMLRRDHAALLTLAHEFGHNLFAAHDRPNNLDTPWASYSYGYVEPGGQWQTIMAVSGAARIDYFSNPNVNWPGPTPPNPGPTGVPEGQPDACDVARTINELSYYVGNFRPTAVPGVPSVLRVDGAAASGGDGTSWGTALNDLREAICIAAGANGAVSEIWVRAGVYTPDGGSGDRGTSFSLLDGVTIFGGFAGWETSAEQRDPSANATILSGEIGSPAVTDNSYHVVDAGGRASSAVLDGFTIRGGYADADSEDGGGGVRVYGTGSPTIRNCVIEDNAGMRGAGVYCAWGASPTLEDCTIRDNVALSASWPSGGAGLHGWIDAAPVLRRCRIVSNIAEYGAGVALFFNASAVFEDCEIADNDAGSSGEGGGMYLYADNQPELVGCLIADNQAGYGGGISSLFNSTPWLIGCTLRGNHAEHDGGGMYNYADSGATLINCTLNGNTAAYGGAMINLFSSDTLLIQSTLAGNAAGSAVGGIYDHESGSVLRNVILWQNRVNADYGEASQIGGFNASPDILHSVVQGWSGALGGMGNNASDPLLRDADGPDNVFGTSDDDLRLSAGSPAIDSGSNAHLPPGVTTDILGRPRILGAQVDRGAYEFGVTAGDINQDGVRDVDDLGVLLACMNGPDVSPSAVSPYTVDDCLAAFDLDSDGDVDLADVADFQFGFP